MPIRAIIFDLDGLMVDSEPMAKQAWRTLLARYGHTLDVDTINAILGLRLADSSRLVRDRYQLPLSAEKLAAEENKLFMASLTETRSLTPMPGLFRLLEAVDAHGLVRAVATSSGCHYASVALEMIGADDGFAAVVTGDSVRNGKPAPDIYLAAAEALSLPPSDCLALEDSPNGVLAAKAAGMRCAAVPNDMTADLDLSAADWIFQSLTAVAEQLDRLVTV
jgi:HAD superfamily hydrolase (TIGR01509 family)